MASDTPGSWERVSAELRAYRDLQQQAWGDIDNATLGRYLAGEVSDEERRQVEQALTELPELRKLTDLVKDVLGECAPVSESAPAILSFPGPAPVSARRAPPPRRGLAPRWRQRLVLLAAACLLLSLGLKMPRLTPVSPPSEPNNLDNSVAMRMGDPADEGLFLVPADRTAAFRAADLPPLGGASEPVPSLAPGMMVRSAPPQLDEGQRRRNLNQAESLHAQARFYQDRGDINRAAPPLSQAHALLAKTIGPQDPRTQRSLQALAQVYAVALNSPSPAAISYDVFAAGKDTMEKKEPFHQTRYLSTPRVGHAGMMAPTPKSSPGTPPRSPIYATVLCERITREKPAVLQSAVTPVLVQAYRQAPTVQERVLYARALGNLGPAARDAVPLLTDRLRLCREEEERQAILTSLGAMGPGARSAIPDLVKTIETADTEKLRQSVAHTLVTLGPCARCAVAECCRDKEPANAALRQALARLSGRDGRIGILDEGDCFSVRAVRQSNHLIHRLAQNANVEVYVQTVCACTEDQRKKCCDQLREMGPHGVCILIERDRSQVQVVVTDSLERQGLKAKELEKVLKRRFHRQEYDNGLLEGMKLVARHATTMGR